MALLSGIVSCVLSLSHQVKSLSSLKVHMPTHEWHVAFLLGIKNKIKKRVHWSTLNLIIVQQNLIHMQWPVNNGTIKQVYMSTNAWDKTAYSDERTHSWMHWDIPAVMFPENWCYGSFNIRHPRLLDPAGVNQTPDCIPEAFDHRSCIMI